MMYELPIEEELQRYGVTRAEVKPMFTADDQLLGKLQMKKDVEAARYPRIFDAKLRTIGVDKEFLDLQVEERKQRELADSRREKAYDGLAVTVDRQLKLLETERTRMQKELERDCKEYSIQNLSLAQRREYDLNDPNALRKDQPGRLADDDPRCGIASMQQFAGEDLNKRERVKRQMAQQADWIEQQIFEKRMATTGKKEADREFADQVAGITILRNDVEEREEVLRSGLAKAQQTFNTQQAETLNGVRRSGGSMNNLLDLRELEHHAQDAFLNESRTQLDGRGRFSKAEYKGLGRDVKVDVQQFQVGQMAERKERLAKSASASSIFATQAEGTRRQLLRMEFDKQRTKRGFAEAVLQENRKLAEEQAAQKENRKQVYRNEVRPEYFVQFGTTTR